MSTTTGVVSKVSTKDVTTKWGTKKTYSINVGGDWYKTGFKDPMVAEGQGVEFSYTEGTYGKEIDLSTLKKTAGVAPSAAPKAATSSSGGGGYSRGVFPIPALDGQRSIIRQNALTNARELYQQGKKEVVMTGTAAEEIIALARKFEAYTAGDLDLMEAEAEFAAEGGA